MKVEHFIIFFIHFASHQVVQGYKDSVVSSLFNELADEISDLFEDHDDNKNARKNKFDSTCKGPNRVRCNFGLRYNGCGSKALQKYDTNILHRQDLEPACDKHDVCYNCGQHYNWTQEECDDSFYNDLLKLCNCQFGNRGYKIAQKTCEISAATMYGAVQIIGGSFYLSKSHEYCTRKCVRDDFNPYEPIRLADTNDGFD